MATNVKFDKLTTAWSVPALPPTQRAYGIHVNYGVHKGAEKLLWGAGKSAIVRDVNNLGNTEVFSEHKAKVNVVAMSPNGNWVASGDDTGIVLVWGYPNMGVKNTVNVGKSVQDLRWSADSQKIIAAGDGSTEYAKAFSYDSPNPVGKIDRITKKILSCDWRPAPNMHRVVTVDEDMVVNFYHGVPFKHDTRQITHKRYPNVVRYAPNAELFATVGCDSKIIFYDGKTGQVTKEIEDKKDGHTGSIYGLSWSKDSKQILTAGADHLIKIWDVTEGKCVHTWEIKQTGDVDDQQAGCVWLPSGKIVSVSVSGVLNFWSLDQNQPTKIVAGHSSAVSSLCVDRANYLAYTSDIVGRVTVWDCKTGDGTWFKGTGHGRKTVSHVAVSANGKTLYTAAFDQTLLISNAADVEFGTKAVALGSNVSALAAGKKDSSLVAVSLTSGVIVLIRDGKIVSRLDTKVKATYLCFNNDDTELAAAGGSAKKARFFTISSDEVKESGASGDEHQVDVSTVTYSDKFFVSTAHSYVDVWNSARDNVESNGWQFHTARISDMKFSPSGQVLCTVAADKSMIFWKDFETFRPKNDVLVGAHQCGIIAFDWLDDNNLVSLGEDGSLKMWSVSQATKTTV